MLTRTLATVGCVFLGLTGCQTFNEPLANSSFQEVPELSGLDRLDVAVRLPQQTDPVSDFERVHWRDLPAELRQEWRVDAAQHVVDTLAATELFASVAYADDRTTQTAVAIDPLISPPGGYCDGQDIFLVMLTLGLVPASCTSDRGVYFRIVGRALPIVACPWPRTIMAGWFPALLATKFGSWTREPNDEAFRSSMRQCLHSQSEAFLSTQPPAAQ